MRRKDAQDIGRRVGQELTQRFGRRRHYSRSEIERACKETGTSAADDVLIAIVLFGPDDIAVDLAKTLSLDFDPGELAEESIGLSAIDANADELFDGDI